MVVTVWFDALCGGMAQAHALLVASDPASEAVLDAAPTAVTLRFNEPVAPLTLDWLLPDGAQVAAEVTARGETLSIVPPGTMEGSYVLSWRVASTDGHPVAGALVFAIGASTLTAPWIRARSRWSGSVLRCAGGLCCMALAAGGAAVAVLTGAPQSRITRPAALALWPLAALAMVVHHVDRGGGALTATLGSPYGVTLSLAVLAGTLALQPGGWLAVGAWVVAALALGASAMRGRPGTGALRWPRCTGWRCASGSAAFRCCYRPRPSAYAAFPVSPCDGCPADRQRSGDDAGLAARPALLLRHPWLGAKLALVAIMLALAIRNRRC